MDATGWYQEHGPFHAIGSAADVALKFYKGSGGRSMP